MKDLKFCRVKHGRDLQCCILEFVDHLVVQPTVRSRWYCHVHCLFTVGGTDCRRSSSLWTVVDLVVETTASAIGDCGSSLIARPTTDVKVNQRFVLLWNTVLFSVDLPSVAAPRPMTCALPTVPTTISRKRSCDLNSSRTSCSETTRSMCQAWRAWKLVVDNTIPQVDRFVFSKFQLVMASVQMKDMKLGTLGARNFHLQSHEKCERCENFLLHLQFSGPRSG